MSGVKRVHPATGVDGVVAAWGMLQNPTMYAGYDCTQVHCVQDWMSEVDYMSVWRVASDVDVRVPSDKMC